MEKNGSSISVLMVLLFLLSFFFHHTESALPADHEQLSITGSSLDLILEIKKGMASKFEMSDLGRLTYYLGIEVLEEKDGIRLSQERYANKILEETSMSKCNSVLIPMEFGLELSKAPHESRINEETYRRNIECLRQENFGGL
ncbi:PREDICTED: uncharacterized protein LOC109127734 isoform X1 [Camelina sativa]|uniref:Uncharacterized protein LOC109127734 isoform X1 n=1 Tax=Camelina sativa TaxID=90675 RepID=A0ABM1QPT1_CAMSA|nr:PREDICTED: uncharacterized protein LOC109127734 isoform X1 [Camelina sativa]